MADLKTKPSDRTLDSLLETVEDEHRRADCRALASLMREITRAEPRMWGDTMVGFGSYHYRYASGREGDWFLTGFAPRKNDLTIYIMAGFDSYPDLMNDLGKYKTGKSCLYIKRLSDIDGETLRALIKASVTDTVKTYGRTS